MPTARLQHPENSQSQTLHWQQEVYTGLSNLRGETLLILNAFLIQSHYTITSVWDSNSSTFLSRILRITRCQVAMQPVQAGFFIHTIEPTASEPLSDSTPTSIILNHSIIANIIALYRIPLSIRTKIVSNPTLTFPSTNYSQTATSNPTIVGRPTTNGDMQKAVETYSRTTMLTPSPASFPR